MDVVRNEY
jgi:uncharacterized protein YrzB (UPF0473 family)